MNKIFKSIVAASVGIAMAIGTGVALGREAKAVYADSDTFVPDAASVSRTCFSLTVAKGSGQTNPAFTNGTKTRVYPKNTVTLTAKTGYVITGWSIAGTINANNKGVYPTGWSITDGSSQLAGEDITATGSETFSISNQSKSTLVFSCSGSAGNIDLTSMTVSYESDGSNTPFISFSDEEISGEEGESFSFTYSAEHLTNSISWSPASGDTEIINYSVNTSTKTVSGTLLKAGSVTLTATSGTASDSINFVVVAPFNGTEYALCTSTNALEAGVSYLITSGTSGTVKTMATTENTNNRPAVDIEVNSGTIISTREALTVTLGGTSEAWTFETENYLGDNGYLASGTSGNDNHLRVTDEPDNCTISFNGSAAIITFSSHPSGRNILRYNSSNKLFACYSSGQQDVYLWRVAKEVTGISLDKAQSNLAVGQTDQLTASLQPAGAAGVVSWTSSNAAVATVEDGLVEAVMAGNATITAQCGIFTATCDVTVANVNAANIFDGATISTVAEVVAINESTHKEAFLDDGTAGLLAFNNNGTLSANIGDVVTVTGSGKMFNGAIEVNNAVFTSASGSVDKISAQTLSTEQVNQYFVEYAKQNPSPFPHSKVSLTTGVIGGSGYYLTWEYGDHMMETHLSTGGMEVGYQYNIEGYLSKFATNNSVTYLCVVVTSASKVESTADSPSEYLSDASSFANVYARESATSIEFDFRSQGYENAEAITDVTFDSNIELVCDAGTNTQNVPGYYTNGSTLHVYANNTMSFSSGESGAKIIKIEFTLPDSSYNTGLSPDSGSLKNGVWNGEATTVEFSLSKQVRIASIKVTYYQDSYSVSSVGMRFGVSIAKAKWDSINNDARWEIVDYGVMMVKKSTLQNTYNKESVEAAYRAGLRVSISNKLKDGAYSNPYLTGNVYSFTARLSSIPSTDYNTVVCAAPFIVVKDSDDNEEYYFLTEIEKSVKELAGEYLTSGGSSLSNKALGILAA